VCIRGGPKPTAAALEAPNLWVGTSNE
jgi:hypothetical protein